MGVRAGLTEIAPDLFAQIAAGEEPGYTGGTRHSIDKAWHDFHAVLRRKGPPLCLAIAGDCLHPLSPHSLDEFCHGNHEYYLGFASPRLVNEVAKSLANVTAADYRQWESELIGSCYSCGHFDDLKTAYLEAAAHKNALEIMIC